MRSLPRRLPAGGTEPPEVGSPIPDLERADLALLAGLAGVGLVPFAGLALGAHEGGGRLVLGAALVLVCGGQLLA
ncbi:MAG TPA: hypothetical protein VFR85_16240, partial [Anaeromyxobacteraceae bacterium]|nr:hypothetical protein [Anaeromyxobacteraceae bacterium]